MGVVPMYSISGNSSESRTCLGCRWWAVVLATIRSARPTASGYVLRSPEVVWVFDQFKLIDAESYEHSYARKNRRPLSRGYYIVVWPKGVNGRLFDEDALFHGPYSSRQHAELTLEQAMRVGQTNVRQPARRTPASPLRGLRSNWKLRQNTRVPSVLEQRLR